MVILIYPGGSILHDSLKGGNLSQLRSEINVVMEKERVRDAMLLTLKTEKEASSQRMWVASRSWKRLGNRFSCRSARRECDFVNILILAH